MATSKLATKAQPKDDTIRGLFGLKPHLNPFTDSKVTPITVACATLLYGVELEIESANEEWVVPGMHVTADNSLRNHGMEFITQPMTLSMLNLTLQRFFERSKVSARNYSERCSVHVHANCHDLTLEQVSTIALLYQTFERLLFKFAGAERDKNIFCVPWHETQLSWALINDFKTPHEAFSSVRAWQKYTGLNLLPLTNYGTIEFRHMPGTHDLKRIIDWCNIIGCMFAYAKANDLESTKNHVVELNTTSAYKNMLDRVFGQWADLLRVPMYEQDLEEGVLNTKYSLMEKKDKIKPAATTSLMEAIAQQQRDMEVNIEIARERLRGAQGLRVNTTRFAVTPPPQFENTDWIRLTGLADQQGGQNTTQGVQFPISDNVFYDDERELP